MALDVAMNAPKLYAAILFVLLYPMIWGWGFNEGTKKYSCPMSMKGE